MAETNDAGQVAVKYYQTIPQRLQVDGKVYVFDVNRNVCMSWVDPADVDKVLAVTKVCCGGQRNTVYRLANASDVRVWTGVAER